MHVYTHMQMLITQYTHAGVLITQYTHAGVPAMNAYAHIQTNTRTHAHIS